jgi:hypothetical protein
MRDLRNEIAHDYDADEILSLEILNAIHQAKAEMKKILGNIEASLQEALKGVKL